MHSFVFNIRSLMLKWKMQLGIFLGVTIALFLSWLMDSLGTYMDWERRDKESWAKITSEYNELGNIPAFEFDFKGEIRYNLYQKE